ncbi:unnamed protein product [Rotaria magnacalcarata]|uniref:Uncharacterized protein n=1 Tax=Rotaria magnacalcarata TaxID=392030 RepID=A0A814I0Y9_9BILA|nr:unnamed protein product [Rotaria magnacalcarata]CAF2109957.1 unnamed protein product [Rotaria magnacalcarata]CAF2141828.1 unnamed protein product [Rotaria magnacalcarata]CAF2242699.1 unnamed protein product [Rotaria magnacalcarata]CAF4072972.1 unnamed protein product [Rotaria magnacalcarata]
MSAVGSLYADSSAPTPTKQRKKSETIYEWYAWSYFNIIFGCLIMGFIAMFLSLRTTRCKDSDNDSKARIWSRITLLWNILATSTGIGLTLYAILQR